MDAQAPRVSPRDSHPNAGETPVVLPQALRHPAYLQQRVGCGAVLQTEMEPGSGHQVILMALGIKAPILGGETSLMHVASFLESVRD